MRTPFGRVLAPPAASRPPTASDRDGNAFLRFAPTLNSAWSFHCARKLACGSPCFIGLTTACFRHWRRPSCAPALRLRGVPCLRTSCARHFSPSGLHLFASVCSAKNARNDVHAVISDESLVLPILCQYSERERAEALSRFNRSRRRVRRGRGDFCAGKSHFPEQKSFLCSFRARKSVGF